MKQFVIGLRDGQIQRSQNVLWRWNDDGSILTLLEDVGQSYLLEGEAVRIWEALGESTQDFDEFDSDVCEKVVRSMLSLGLLLEQSGGHFCKVDLPGIEVDQIQVVPFGACQCATAAGKGTQRNIYCETTGQQKLLVSAYV
jgi:hypothetical protein